MRLFLLISSFLSQTNNQVHRSPKCFSPPLTLSSGLRLQPACLKLASCALTSWLWRPSWDSRTGKIPTANKWGTPLEKGSNRGKWPQFNSELPAAFPGTAAGEDQILSRTTLVLLLGVPPALHQFSPPENMAQPGSHLGFALLPPSYHPTSRNSCTRRKKGNNNQNLSSPEMVSWNLSVGVFFSLFWKEIKSFIVCLGCL